MTRSISLEGYIDIPTELLAKATAGLCDHVKQSRARLGCFHFDIQFSTTIENRILIEAKFADQDAVDRYFKPAEETEWSKVTVGLPRIFQISYDT